MTTNSNITRKYQIAYQLGSRGTEHATITSALKALAAARRTCRRHGDLQGVTLQVNEYRGRNYYGQGDLTEAETEMLWLA